ncbi:MAG: hypothetical protein IJD04_06315 [Desulfovibrionaceae bacterium]|nr:hypothetical protein [Desulfovibrionaceae bacterium]
MTDERPKVSLLEDLQDLDRKLVKLIARRAEILQKLSAHRHRSPRAASRYAGEEKELRKNWEQAASRLSRDERFLRDAFSLLQEITLIPGHLEERKDSLYNLAPPRKPVEFDLPAPVSQRLGLMWVAAAAGWGAKLELPGQALSDMLVELIKALNQAGAHLSWERDAAVFNRGGGELSFADKTIFAGNSVLNFYLLSALPLGRPGVVKFTGDSALKLHDFSIWRNVMPLFGARLAHVIPKTRGLPVHLECSGLVPDEVTLPPDLPQDAVMALMLAASTWEKNVRFLDNGTSAFKTARQEILLLFEGAGLKTKSGDGWIDIAPALRQMSLQPKVCIDLRFALLLLGFGIMAGGKARLQGIWPEFPEQTCAVESVLAWAGFELRRDERSIELLPGKAAPDALRLDSLPEWSIPFVLAFGARLALNEGLKPRLAVSESVMGLKLETAREFLQVLGADLEVADGEDGCRQIVQTAQKADGATAIWTAPDSDWGLAMALGAYLRPNISLTNPAQISKVFPAFWSFYNSLPQPGFFTRGKEEPVEEKKRRKVIARGVASDLAELRADYEPPNDDE